MDEDKTSDASVDVEDSPTARAERRALAVRRVPRSVSALVVTTDTPDSSGTSVVEGQVITT